jgi:hypothetical protein
MQCTDLHKECTKPVSKIKYDNPHEVRNEVIRFNIMQAQVKEVVLIFNLEYRLSAHQERYHMDC